MYSVPCSLIEVLYDNSKPFPYYSNYYKCMYTCMYMYTYIQAEDFYSKYIMFNVNIMSTVIFLECANLIQYLLIVEYCQLPLVVINLYIRTYILPKVFSYIIMLILCHVSSAVPGIYLIHCLLIVGYCLLHQGCERTGL